MKHDQKRLLFAREMQLKHKDDVGISDKAVINKCVSIGQNVIIGDYATIGTQGFGYAITPEGIPIHIPHGGGVILEDGVRIFEHTNIARGTVDNTVIGKNTTIDAHCHVGHNTIIGENCIICANTVIGGSSKIGNNTFIGIGVTIRDHAKIGNNSTIGCGTVVIHDVPDGATIIGNPGKELIKDAVKTTC